jgi:hypothetical protein
VSRPRAWQAYKKGVRVSVTIAPRASAMLDELLLTGLYGRNRAAIAQEFIYRGLREALEPDGPLRDPPQPKRRAGRYPRRAVARTARRRP